MDISDNLWMFIKSLTGSFLRMYTAECQEEGLSFTCTLYLNCKIKVIVTLVTSYQMYSNEQRTFPIQLFK